MPSLTQISANKLKYANNLSYLRKQQPGGDITHACLELPCLPCDLPKAPNMYSSYKSPTGSHHAADFILNEDRGYEKRQRAVSE